jgi:hypothetical protein
VASNLKSRADAPLLDNPRDDLVVEASSHQPRSRGGARESGHAGGAACMGGFFCKDDAPRLEKKHGG